MPPPPPPVTVGQPIKQAVVDYLELTGSTQPSLTATLTARVEGYLQSVDFKDGSFVKEGDLLFVIEPAPYEAKVKQQQANVEQQQALLDHAKVEYDRQQRMVKQNATSEANVDKWRADRDFISGVARRGEGQSRSGARSISAIRASLRRSTGVSAGTWSIRGNLVGAGAPTKLATIDKLDPMYAYFNVSENDVLRIRNSLRKRGLARPGAETTVPVQVGLQTEDGYPHQGRLDFIDTGRRRQHRHAADPRRPAQLRPHLPAGPLRAHPRAL